MKRELVSSALAFALLLPTSEVLAISPTVQDLLDRVAVLEAALDAVDLDEVVALGDVLTVDGDTVRFEGVNVQIVNNLGQTNLVDGTGNLIIGFDEDTNQVGQFGPDICSDGTFDNESDCLAGGGTFGPAQKIGSHNLVVGIGHSYTQFGGIVAGASNAINGVEATVTGGLLNIASGRNASVTGGVRNVASGDSSSITAGGFNIASGEDASVNGGEGNIAAERSSVASGGLGNSALGPASIVLGGNNNKATGSISSIIGGKSNDSTGSFSSIIGGVGNETRGEFSSISGGLRNIASGEQASVSGGNGNIAAGLNSSVSGGRDRTAPNTEDWAAGSLFEDF